MAMKITTKAIVAFREIFHKHYLQFALISSGSVNICTIANLIRKHNT